MKKRFLAALLVCLLILTACAPASTSAPKQEKGGYEKFAAAYQKSKELDSSHYELSVFYDIAFENGGSNLLSESAEITGSVITVGVGGNNVSFLCDSQIKYSYYDEAFSETTYYADGTLYNDAYSAVSKTRSKHSAECMYGVALGSLMGHYEFMNFPESAVLSQDVSADQDIFFCSLLSEKMSGYLYSFTATPLYDTIGTALTKWEFSDIALENTLTGEGYLTAQKWTVTANGLIPDPDATGIFIDAAITIRAELKLNTPETPAKITPPNLIGYTPVP